MKPFGGTLRLNLFRKLVISVCAIGAPFVPTQLSASTVGVPTCNLDADVISYMGGDEDGPVQEVLTESEIPMLGGMEAPPPTLTSGCGRGTELISTLPNGSIRVSFGAAHAFDYVPLLLTDKRSGAWSCNKIKIRTACVASQTPNGDGTVSVTLKVDGGANATTEIHRVHADGRAEPPPNAKFFVLIPRYRKTSSGKPQDRVAKFSSAADQAGCATSTAQCSAKRGVFVERAAIKELRVFRLPRVLSIADRKFDAQQLQEWTNKFGGDESLVHLAIAASEIGWSPGNQSVSDSPFEIVDAILGNSGPSYGVHQIDLATNGSADVVPFRKLMPDVLKEMGADRRSPLQPPPGAVGSKPFKFEKPIRAWEIALAAEFYRATPYMVTSIRTPQFRTGYESQYLGFLKTSADAWPDFSSADGFLRKARSPSSMSLTSEISSASPARPRSRDTRCRSTPRMWAPPKSPCAIIRSLTRVTAQPRTAGRISSGASKIFGGLPALRRPRRRETPKPASRLRCPERRAHFVLLTSKSAGSGKASAGAQYYIRLITPLSPLAGRGLG